MRPLFDSKALMALAAEIALHSRLWNDNTPRLNADSNCRCKRIRGGFTHPQKAAQFVHVHNVGTVVEIEIRL